ncbi:MAG: quinone-dependent dihydroorotate dehydrogenase [Verrucomicrobiota bacterium]
MRDWVYEGVKAALFQLPAEVAHHQTLRMMALAERMGMLGVTYPVGEEWMRPVTVMGVRFPNAVGLAAGMDKAGEAVDAFGAIGFGHVEVGTVTPRPQPGNPRPRLFRLVEQEAVINRMGFNNPGMDAVLEHLSQRKSFSGVLGINLGKNFDTPNEEAVEDYQKGLRKAYQEADYLVVNLSSPNTKGLRDLQAIDSCQALLETLQRDRDDLVERHDGLRRPIAVKLSPDLEEDHLKGLAEMLSSIQVDGVIVTNTTLDRSRVKGHPSAEEAGGLSGAPLRERARDALRLWREALSPKIPIISVGGIGDGEEARRRLELGASLVQVYTGLIYRGPVLVREMLQACAAV